MNDRLQERVTRGTRLFPFQHYYMTAANGPIFVPYHWHKELEIILAYEGEAELLIDGKKYRFSQDDIYFINPGQLHQIRNLTDACTYYAYVFSLDSLSLQDKMTTSSRVIQRLGRELLFPLCLRPGDRLYRRIADEIRQIIQTNEEQIPGYELITSACLYKIIGYLISCDRFVKAPAADSAFDLQQAAHRRLVEYLQTHYGAPIRIKDVASIVHVSEQYFSTYFSNLFGMTFTNYMNQYRIEQACVLLLTTDQTVTEIGCLTGFRNTSYFIKKFKEYLGVTPYTYRSSF